MAVSIFSLLCCGIPPCCVFGGVMSNYVEIDDLIGKLIVEIKGKEHDDTLEFVCDDGLRYVMYHEQDCCEGVAVEDICGDLNDLIGSPIVKASEDTNSDEPKPNEYSESFTWTFYNIATAKGHVTIRWLGESNGFYLESVSIKKIAS